MPAELLVFLLVMMGILTLYLLFQMQSAKIDNTESRIEIMILRLEEKIVDTQDRVATFHSQTQKQIKLLQDLLDAHHRMLDNHETRINIAESKISILERKIKKDESSI